MSTGQNAPTVSIVIVAWNSGGYLPHCLEALSTQTWRDFEVIVVDNGSTDGAVETLARKYSEIEILVEPLLYNRGFAAANNIGARRARGSWLALLNPDAFPEADWLKNLMNAVRKFPPSTIFASRQVQADRRDFLDGEGDNYHISGLAWRRNYNRRVYPTDKMVEVFSACGASALYPRQIFLDAGGFDEDYFAYHEDVDLGFRLRLRGLKCIFVPQAVVMHVGSATTGKKSDFSTYYGHRNLVWTYAKDMPGPFVWLCLPLHLAMNILSLVYFPFRAQGVVIWRAKLDALRGLPAILRKRSAIQHGRRIPSWSIYQVMIRNPFTPFITSLGRKQFK